MRVATLASARRLLLVAGAAAAWVLSAAPLDAAPIHFTNRAAWQAAVSGETGILDAAAFADWTSGPFVQGTVYGNATLSNASTSSGSHLTVLTRSGIGKHFENVASPGTFAIRYVLPDLFHSVAFDYDIADTDGLAGINVQFRQGTTVIDSFHLGHTFSQRTFAGFTTSAAFDNVLFIGDSTVSTWIGNDDLQFGDHAAVPEPATLSLLGIGLAGAVARRRMRKTPAH